jgi:cytochrome c5
MDYPIWDVAMGGGLLMAVVAIAHVIVSHFAIGGGLVIAVTETLAVRRDDRELRELARRGSLMLILVSTVFGAISGVGIWVVAGLISPGAISALIHNYVWGWAIEWTFFVVEIVAALLYYATWDKISKGAHLAIGWIYFVSAYLSLVVINGIVTFMLTPGRWLETHAFWDGFFNPTYWPSLALRTGICAMMASAFLLFVVQKRGGADRPRQLRYLGAWLFVGGLVCYYSFRWWESALPETVTSLFQGEAPTIAALAATRSVALWALAIALGLTLLALLAFPRAGRGVVLVVVALAAFTFFGGYERLREGTRKPFLIHSYQFSNGLRVADIEHINGEGLAAHTGWVAARAGEEPEIFGRAIFSTQCSSCHTLDGYQAIRPLLPTTADLATIATDEPAGAGPALFASKCARCHDDYTYEEVKDFVPGPADIEDDPEFVREFNLTMITGTLERLRDMGAHYAGADPTATIDASDADFPYMPPFVGTDDELEALAAYLWSLEEADGGTAAAES